MLLKFYGRFQEPKQLKVLVGFPAMIRIAHFLFWSLHSGGACCWKRQFGQMKRMSLSPAKMQEKVLQHIKITKLATQSYGGSHPDHSGEIKL